MTLRTVEGNCTKGLLVMNALFTLVLSSVDQNHNSKQKLDINLTSQRSIQEDDRTIW